jgi:hypothetical protein
MIPLPVRLAIVLLGLALFVGSWFIGNSVDSGGVADLPSSSVMAKDGLTFGARVVGVFIMVAGLLMWVVSENTVNHHGLF